MTAGIALCRIAPRIIPHSEAWMLPSPCALDQEHRVMPRESVEDIPNKDHDRVCVDVPDNPFRTTLYVGRSIQVVACPDPVTNLIAARRIFHGITLARHSLESP